MQIYSCNKPINGPLLEQQILSGGLVGLLRIQGKLNDDNSVWGEVVFTNPLNPTDVVKLTTIITNHDASQLTVQQQSEQDAIIQNNSDRSAINTAVSQLNTIINAQSLTAAQMLQAIQALATNQEKLITILHRHGII